MKAFFRFLFAIVFLGTSLTAAVAQVSSPLITEPANIIDTRGVQLDAINRSLSGTVNSDTLRELRNRALEIQAALMRAVEALEPQLAEVDRRLGQLGEASDGEDADIVAQREKLRTARAQIDSDIKRGRLLLTDTASAIETINAALAEAFRQNTMQKMASPLSPQFWQQIGLLRDDVPRISRFMAQSLGSFDRLSMSSALWAVIAGVIAFVLVQPLRQWLEALGFKVAIKAAPPTRIRRSGIALWFTIVGTVTTALSLVLIAQAIHGLGFFTASEGLAFFSELVGVGTFAGFVISLGRALLLVDRESWRLPPLTDNEAKAVSNYPVWASANLVFGVALMELNRLAGTGPVMTAISNLVVAILYAVLLLAFLRRWYILRLQRKENAGGSENNQATPLFQLVAMVFRIAVVIALVAILLGYVNLALFIGRELIWVMIIAATGYLLLLLIDDFAEALSSPDGLVARQAHAALSIRPETVRQAGVLISAVLRIAILFFAVVLIFAPVGPGSGTVFSGLGDLSSITIAGITFRPSSVLRALFVLGVGLAALHFVLGWLEETYLPTTRLDSGARNSTVMIVKYAGYILAGLWSINTLGIGIERIALIVSALSVGIGFGLQAITQNFISGLILLAERPLKIGDTVRVGTDEGDVRKISVRATEIQIADRSTLIVPNSELITKTIRNMTPTDPVGRLEIAFGIPIDADPQQARKLVLDLFEEHPGILDDPRPTVLIDSIADGRINFKSFAFVASAKNEASIKSALLFDFLERFRQEGIVLHTS